MEFFSSLAQNFLDILSYPSTYLTLIAILIMIIAVIKMRKVRLDTRTIAQIGLVIALTVVLKMFKVYTAPYGGSVTIGSMAPILILSLIYGPEVGLLTGFLYGLIDFIMGPYILHPLQVVFDYPLPFMMIGIAGFFKNKSKKFQLFGVVLAILGRFLCHYFAGVAFWGSYAPEGMSPYWYSFIYNATYLPLDGLICLVIIGFMPLKRIASIINKQHITRKTSSVN